MGFLYILSEGQRDEDFYDLIAERVTGRTFDRPAEFRLRHGANLRTALAGGRLLLNRCKHWPEPQDVSLILAIDNDRAPGHPGSTLPHPRHLLGADLKKEPRHPSVQKMIVNALGPDRTQWPINVAVAMPVEMIESWVLLLCNPQRPTLPLFAAADQPSARHYYAAQPPSQLKDLCKTEAAALNQSLEELFWHAASQNIEDATAVSASLAMFVEELRAWNNPRLAC